MRVRVSVWVCACVCVCVCACARVRVRVVKNICEVKIGKVKFAIIIEKIPFFFLILGATQVA